MFKGDSDKDDSGPPKIIELNVKKSRIKIPGSCRVHNDVLKKIDVEEKTQVAIHFDGDTILCTLYADSLIGKDAIKIRADDMDNLKVKKNETVSIGSRKDMKRHLKLLKAAEKEEE